MSWSPSHAAFAGGIAYTATITLTAKPGYTLEGVEENFFTVAGAAATNSADSGVVKAVFSATPKVAFNDAAIVGDTVSVTAGAVEFDMIYANNQNSITFPFSIYNNETATLMKKFFMSETQVTNALFAEVLNWAKTNNKISESGTDNLVNAETVKYGGQELLNLNYGAQYMSYSTSDHKFSVAEGYEDHPVVCVTWYGAIMFCNWLTEMRDGVGNTDNCVYTVPDTGWDNPTATVENTDRNGYRLPLSREWEYAARYIGTIPPEGGTLAAAYIRKDESHATLTEGYCWTPAAYASGAIKDYNDGPATRAVAWYKGDPLMEGVNKLMPVKQKEPNQLGLYDMSGNVWEWCSTARESRRVARGGSWSHSADFMQAGFWYDSSPIYAGINVGFRFARTQ